MADLKYIISSALDQVSKQLNLAQRTSSLFSEAPTIAGKILRRGVSITMTEAQYLGMKSRIDALLKAGAITVKMVGSDGKVTVSVDTDPKADLKLPTVSVKASGPSDGPVAPGVVDAARTMVEEAVTDVVKAVAPEIAPVVEKTIEVAKEAVTTPPDPTKKHNKKGK